MAGKKVRVLKNVGGGLRGSTSGLRFNPREAPEFAEEDRNLGRDDPKGKQKEDERKRKEKEMRHKKIAGLHHISLKIPNKKRAKGDRDRNDEELSEMTGPVSSTGYPSDVASGAKTGGGSAMGGPNIMTSDTIVSPSDILKRIGGPKTSHGSSRGRHGRTDTIRGIRQQERRERTAETRKQMGPTTESALYTAQNGLALNNTKQPWLLSLRHHPIAKRVGSGINRIRRGLKTHNKGWGAHGGSFQKDLRKTQSIADRNHVGRSEGTGRKGARATGKHGTTIKPSPRGSAVTTPANYNTAANLTPSEPAASHRPGTRQTVGGGMPIADKIGRAWTGVVGQSPTATFGRSEDTYQETADLLMKATISQTDLVEFKWLVRELRRLLRSGGLKKAGLEDAEHDEERPTPNAHRKTTSSPTGATSVDPDDDPRYWGAHPMGLLLPRRGHQ